ncbi:glycosyltransferase family 4 protein [Candidatus Woesearchaeota archaeon]|nr:glycosyltransferase family 4 protein [Candidatus Woesearchaeota archaeon]
MKTILISSDCYLPRWDGIARFLSQLLPELNNEFKIIVAVPDFGKSQKYKNVEEQKFPLIKIQFGDIYLSRVNNKRIKELVSRCDFVFNQTIGPIGRKTIKQASKQNKPIISYVHSIEWELASKGVKYFKTLVRIFVKILVKRLYKKCSLLILPSKEMEDILTVKGIKTKKEVIELGVNTETFKPADKNLAKERLGLKNKFIIGYCGRLSREKDLPTLFNAFLRAKKNQANVKLLIVGDGPAKEELKHPDVILVGAQNNVVPYLQAMDLYVLPSLTETSSLSTMEAMSCEIPVIVTPVGNIKEYVRDRETGLFFPRGDFKSLARKISLLLKNPIMRERLAKAGRQIIQKRHDWKNTAEAIKKRFRKY